MGAASGKMFPHLAPQPHPMTDRTPHPHFNDKGTLDWTTSLADAKAKAQAEGKRIFIEFGREL